MKTYILTIQYNRCNHLISKRSVVQNRNSVCAMIKSIRFVLSPLLTMCYMLGLRIVKFPTNYRRPCFSLLYILLLWSVYCILFRYTVVPYISIYNIVYRICLCVDIFALLLSIAVGVYHDKKFKNCLKKLTIVDNTLKELGTTTNYHKLYIRMIWFVLGLIVIMILINYVEALWLQDQTDYNIATAIYITCMINYCSHLNFISNLIFTSIVGYIRLKFDQINECLQNLIRDESGIKRTWEDPMLHSHQRRFPKAANNEWLIWVLMQLHLELRKISREIDSIFGTEMTISIGCNFCWLALNFREILNVILINDYTNNSVLYAILMLMWFFYFIVKLLFINYVCERVSIKANITGNLINRISHSNCVNHENISQFLLQITQAPLKFCGLGLFQFGNKLLHYFSQYAATILVILVQMHTNK